MEKPVFKIITVVSLVASIASMALVLVCLGQGFVNKVEIGELRRNVAFRFRRDQADLYFRDLEEAVKSGTPWPRIWSNKYNDPSLDNSVGEISPPIPGESF